MFLTQTNPSLKLAATFNTEILNFVRAVAIFNMPEALPVFTIRAVRVTATHLAAVSAAGTALRLAIMAAASVEGLDNRLNMVADTVADTVVGTAVPICRRQ